MRSAHWKIQGWTMCAFHFVFGLYFVAFQILTAGAIAIKSCMHSLLAGAHAVIMSLQLCRLSKSIKTVEP